MLLPMMEALNLYRLNGLNKIETNFLYWFQSKQTIIITMEKRINTKLEDYIKGFKDSIRDKALSLEFNDHVKLAELMEYIYDFDRPTLEKDDFIKRKRVKNSIPELNRCVAKRANGEQCTRRRKDECEFCGTHYKGTPHGLVQTIENENAATHKMEVFAEEINGIVYYLDKYKNVYKTEDILVGKENPAIIAQWVKRDTTYTIPELGLV